MPRKDPFNPEQRKALDTSINENVAISAGAGSGKTNTLTEKISLLLNSGEIKPSELLVLTFTNNSAHDMKMRAISKCQDYPMLKDQILSSHIQTFDSFLEYLVNRYSYKLGIADNIKVANQDVIDTRILVMLDAIFNEYYSSPSSYKEILLTLKKLSMHDDEPLRKIILDLYNKIDDMMDDERDEFINKCNNYYLSSDFFVEMINQYVSHYKKLLEKSLVEAEFIEQNYEALFGDKFDAQIIENVFYDNNRIRSLKDSFSNYAFTGEKSIEAFNVIQRLLPLEGVAFIKELIPIIDEYTEDGKIFGNAKQVKTTDNKDKTVLNILRQAFSTNDALLRPLYDFGLRIIDKDGNIDFSNEYLKVISFKDDIKLCFDIVEKLSSRIEKYQRDTNAYTFKQIGRYALKLLEMDDVKEKIKETFKYIMIDEYQDTNDKQERFINILLEPRKSDKGRATLFVVGDAKQSIYAFRNSNVELFKARLEDKDTNPAVINMNKNYRSGEKLLEEINYIFSYYMSLNHGGIDYKKEGEALSYDKEVDLYNEPYPLFGIHRITSKSKKNYDGLTSTYLRKLWECYAIATDIKKKVEVDHIKVSERTRSGNIIRDARYSDFSILTRTKGQFKMYAKVFAKLGIKLNLKSETNLTEINAIILLQSLIDMIGYVLGVNEKADVRHLFASIARSYIYQYDDETIFNILTDEGRVDKNDISKIQGDKIYQDILSFAQKHENESFSTIYLDMLSEFKILDKLYLIGDVKDNVDKIESLYKIIMSLESSKEGLKEFIELMKNIQKKELSLDSSSEVSLQDAVEMMTIHASKGLERKFIYLPNVANKFVGGSNQNKPDYLFSKDNGIIFPYYQYTIDNSLGEPYYKESTFVTLPYALEKLKGNNSEIDEHVRLLYVALTRAENTIYIVGDPIKDKSDKKDENLYGMLSYAPHYPKINEKILSVIKDNVSKDLLDELDVLSNKIKEDGSLKNENEFNKETYQYYLDFYQKYYVDALYSRMEAILEEIETALFIYYYNKLDQLNNLSLDQLSAIFSSLVLNRKVNTFNELINYLEITMNMDDEDNEDEEDDESFDKGFHFSYQGKEELKNYLINHYHHYLKEADVDGLKLDISQKKIDSYKKKQKEMGTTVPLMLKDDLLSILMNLVDDIDYIYYWSYQNDSYSDYTYSYDYRDFDMLSEIKKPVVEEFMGDDTAITFEERFKEKASKSIEENDEDLSKIFERGTYLHRLLELCDFSKKDVSFIYNKKDQELIKKVLYMPIFNEVNKAKKVYREYGYYDIKRGSYGYIDLFFINEEDGIETYTILDYKTRHTKDDGYVRQLNIYKENIIRLFNLDESKVKFRLLLLSIEDAKTFEV